MPADIAGRVKSGPLDNAAESRPPKAPPTTATVLSISGGGDQPSISVLLISDLLLIRAGLRQLLEARGFAAVSEAPTCKEALDATSRERFDVVVVDMESANDTVACLQELVTVAARAIALADRRGDMDPSELIESGATGVVLKNEAPDVLIKAITKVNAGEVWIDRVNTAKLFTRFARKRYDDDIEAEKIARLTPREREVIELVGEGLRNRAIAERLFISEATVRNHLTSILDKVELSARFELVVYAYKHGLVRGPGLQPLPAVRKG